MRNRPTLPVPSLVSGGQAGKGVLPTRTRALTTRAGRTRSETCVVGVRTDEGIVIGGDSAITNSAWVQTIVVGTKVFFIGDEHRGNRMLLGCTGSCRMMQLLQYELQVPSYAGEDVLTYLVVTFISCVRECLKTGGFARKENEQEEGGRFLVGFAGRLFEIQSDYHVSEPTSGYEAVGSGASFALGALAVTPHLPPEQRITGALAAAIFHNASVRPPYTILRLDPGRGYVHDGATSR